MLFRNKLLDQKFILKNMANRENIGQFFRFIIIGFINTGHYYAFYLFFIHLVQLNYLPAHIFAFLISMIGSFFLNCYITYRTKPTIRKFLQFPLTYAVNITVSTVAIYLLVDLMNLNENISPLIAQGITIPITFLVSKKILAKESRVN
jgi:putative flippase GtrA